jgi:hypothetical protein
VSVDSALRARRLLADNFAVVALVLLALALAAGGGVLAYDAYVADGTTTETRSATVYETTPEFTHGAVVQRENSVFEVGTRLSERNVYYERIAPVLSGEYRVGYRAPGGDATVRLTTTLVHQGTADDGATVLWEKRTPLASEEATGVAPGESVAVPYRVNVTEARNRVAATTEELGTSGAGVRTFVEARVELSGTVAGESVNATYTDRLGIVAGGGTYRPDTNASAASATRQETVRTPTTAGPLARFGGPLLLALGLVGLAGLGVGRRSGRLVVSDGERQLLAHQRARAEFDEWITTASVPDSVVGPRDEHVEVADLEGLVDVAIDTNGRVIEDERRGFLVVSGDRTYRYDPPTEPAITRVDDD